MADGKLAVTKCIKKFNVPGNHFDLFGSVQQTDVSITTDRQVLDGVYWWLTFHPFKRNETAVYFHVSKHVINATVTINIESTKATKTGEIKDKWLIFKNVYINILNDCVVKCAVEFEGIHEPLKVSTFNDTVVNATHYLPDVEIVVDKSTLKVHRHFLRMISPVFNAYFTNNSKESQTGIVKIDDFQFQTVQNAIDYCHGRDIPDLSIEETTDILRFADKYDVKSITSTFEQVLFRRLNYANFNPVAAYAWKFAREELKKRCCEYYKKNPLKLIFNEDFLDLPTTVRDEIMRSALSSRNT